jgi:hypothetical protein
MYVTGINSAIAAIGSPPPNAGILTYATLAAWSAASARDLNSLSIDPLFANPTGTWPEDFRPNAELNGLSGAGGLATVANDFRFTNIRPITPNPLPPTMGAWEMCKVIITQEPVNNGGCEGENASFTVVAIGSGTLTYQWQVSTNGGGAWSNLTNAAPYSGVTTATLTITGLTASMNTWQYRCLVTSNVSATTIPPNPIPWNCTTTDESQPATLSVSTPPTTSLIWHQ